MEQKHDSIGECDMCGNPERYITHGKDSFGVHVMNYCTFGCSDERSVMKEGKKKMKNILKKERVIMKSIYKTEKDLLIEKMWKIVLDATKENEKIIDDAGCDWFTINNQTYIGSIEWLVSNDLEVARLVNAINSLNGSNKLINKYNEIKDETTICKKCNNEVEVTALALEYDKGNMCIPCYMKTDEYKKEEEKRFINK
ncbi:hypothetical protein [Bacillus cereus]